MGRKRGSAPDPVPVPPKSEETTGVACADIPSGGWDVGGEKFPSLIIL